MRISSKHDAEQYRQNRYQSHKSTQNIIRMKDDMATTDPAILLMIDERNRNREIARLDRIERHNEYMEMAKKK